MAVSLPVGNDSFSEIRENGDYFIDKSEVISEILKDNFKVYLITRPRRFGKTLTMSMLEDFFDISRDSKKHFEGLKISENTSLCSEWMNQWPVIFITFKNVEGRKFENAYGALKVFIADLCKKYSFLKHSEKVNPADKEQFTALEYQKAEEENLRNSLILLTRMISMHYGKQCILLIDEYDVPLAKASENGYYNQMLDVVRALFGALKTNDYLKFAVITGCLKIAKESIFTGTNNFVSDTISGERFDEYIGFTHDDVKKLLKDSGFSDHEDEVRLWYDGYRFGTVNVYCPWDVLNHVAALQINPNAKPKNYWGSTSHNGVIYRFISRKNLNVNDKFEVLMSGGILVEKITEDLTYDTLNSSETNLWSLLLLTGYLTRTEMPEEYICNSESEMALRIPNEEVKIIFKNAIADWFNEDVSNINRESLFNAFWSGNEEIASEQVTDILFSTISYYDYSESYYHAFLAGLFAGVGYIVQSNYENGTGRPDIVVKDKVNRRALVIEVKHAKSEADISTQMEEAKNQIIKSKYAWGLERGYREVACYGVVFFEKTCVVSSVKT